MADESLLVAVKQKRKSAVRVRVKAKHGTSLITAYEAIRGLITYGKLAPGAWVIEGDLARHLNMSRTPIRGALHQLHRDGFLLEQKGMAKSRMVVAPLTRKDAEDIYSIIGRVEGLCGRRITEMDMPERTVVVRDLEDVNERLRQIARSKPTRADEIFELDRSFHRVMVEAGASPRLSALHLTVRPQAERYWRLYATPIFLELKFSVAEHEAIIAAILTGDPDRVEKAIQRNWEGGITRLDKVIATFGERGEWSASLR